MTKVLITMGKSFYQAYPALAQEIGQLGADVITKLSDAPLEEEEILPLVKDIDAYIVAVEKIGKNVIDAAPRLKYIHKHGAGYDNIDVAYATKRGILVSYAPGQNAYAVADLAMGLMLAVSRKIAAADRLLRRGGWELVIGNELHGKTLGIMGLGFIGKQVALRAKAFGMKIVAYDIFEDKEFARQYQIEYVSQTELLRSSDYISLHMASTPQNIDLINRNTIALMKPTAYLVNTSRGKVVCEDDLIEALEQKTIAGAGLDVFNSEPPSHRFMTLDNVVCTCHIGGSTYEAAERLSHCAVDNMRRFMHGEVPDNVVNQEASKLG